MAWPIFPISPKKSLGVDIGTSVIRVVELSKAGEKIKLENYGYIQSKFLYEKPFRISKRGILSFSTHDIAKTIAAILEEAKIRTRIANFSIPDFSSFFTTFQLPPMTKEELSQAIRFEARQHVPLPISEIVLDWILIEGEPSSQKKQDLKVMLVAVPKRVVQQYQEIANLAGLEPQNLEAEVFALKRALIDRTEDKEKVVVLVDIGAESTTCSVVEGGILKVSHSFDISGNNLTKSLVDSLQIDIELAEELKLKYGLLPAGQVIHRVLQPFFDSIIIEIRRISQDFLKREGKDIQEIILAGGTANIRGIKGYFEEKIKKEINIGNPFSNISYPQILEKTLRENGPPLAIAIGLALERLK